MSVRLESGSRTGWLYQYHSSTDNASADEERGADETNAGSVGQAALVLLFQDHAGDKFHVHLHYKPYILVMAVEGHEREVELGLMSMFGPRLIFQIEHIEKEDMDLLNHLSGRRRPLLKVSFHNVQDLALVRGAIEKMVARNTSMATENPLSMEFNGSLADAMGKTFENDFAKSSAAGTDRWADWVQDMREYDVKYFMRVAIDMNVYCGCWYDATVTDGEATVVRCDDSKYTPAMPRIVAFDIETTKAPLRFPQPETDQIYMISYMLDNRGYLIVNRDIVTADISPFEYTPKPEYEGFFETFNEPDEAATLRRFYGEMRKYEPNVYVTFNGDYFDFPFIHARSLFHGMSMYKEIGFSQAADGAFLNPRVPHLDCFYWVKRDSYLPQGSQGLKAVTKYKLGYDPIEVDPEEMLPLAQSHPHRMASYSVSDAVSTWYLYEKYVHPFIFSLTTIIPMSPDDVLRKGSGGLCESLLMVQAYAKNVVFPNKKETIREKFHDGHLIDTETYIGGRVEALRSGVYRSDIPQQFDMNPEVYQSLIDDVDNALRFALEIENGVKLEEVTNYDEVKSAIVARLGDLRDNPHQKAKPLIYHLDVGAMYPNIILTNRLQPYAIPSPDVCAACCFNSPSNEFQCKRVMSWKWRAELFTANRYEYQRLKAQLENESFAANVIEQANLAAVQKKAYGNRKGNVLEGTAYERKGTPWGKKNRGGRGGGGGGYRQENKRQAQEAKEALIQRQEFGGGNNSNSDDDDNDDDDDAGGLKAYHKLNDNTRFNMLKRRLTEYSRKAYGKIRESREVVRTNVVCQRQNPFYVDTVRLFRDRRYEYKAALKTWKGKLAKATTTDDKKLCQSRCVQMESLQLAHKCILNSFYGYVMRKGSRWSSMEMAGIVTYLGATLIQMARALVEQIGVTLELDTDGIWCCLPKSFPDTFSFTTSNPKKPKVSISYPCVVLNKMVHDRYSNHQYQDLLDDGTYRTRSECSIYFEVDGPYLSMQLPASREEGKSIKKRYAVFNEDGSLAELKGFELKRRGELMLIKDFQSQVFRRFLDGETLAEAYASAAVVADAALDLLESKGEGFDEEEILEKITESSNMSRRLAEYPETQKSLAITTARRIAEFLGPQMVKDKGLACHFIISRLPAGRPVTERAIPITIFRAEPALRSHFLRKWTGDASLPADADMRDILDWDYYTGRFNSCVQKIVTIPAALQHIPNPVPRVPHPDWLQKRIQQQNSRFRQVSLTGMMEKKRQEALKNGDGQPPPDAKAADMEDLFRREGGGGGGGEKKMEKKRTARGRRGAAVDVDDNNDDDDDDDDDDINAVEEEEDDMERQAREREEEESARAAELQSRYFSPHSKTPLTADFFASPGAARFIQTQRQGWLHRAKLRKELAAASPDYSAQLQLQSQNPHFVDIRSKALSTTWNVLEVREDDVEEAASGAGGSGSGTLTVIAALDRALYTFPVQVPRHVIVAASQEAGQLIARTLPYATEVLNKVLPRHQAADRVFQLDVQPGSEGEGQLNSVSIIDGVQQLYEAHVSRKDRFIETVGCCANVSAALHLKNARARPASRRDVFDISELEPSSAAGYLRNFTDRSAFVFHVAGDTRGVLAVVNHQSRSALVVFVQPAAAARPALNWEALFAEAATALHAPASEPLSVTVKTAVDVPAAWRLISQELSEYADSGRAPLVVVLESTQSTQRLLRQRALPAQYPYLRTLGAAEDERLLTDAFRWTRLLGKRLLQRNFASVLWLAERLSLSRASGIPLCNMNQDSYVHALDVLYSRALHRRGHVLWNSADPAVAFDPIEERPREVVVPGGYTSWCVEFSLSRLDVVAILFSQMIQENDDPNAHVLSDRGVTTHFNILRDMIADILGQAVQNSAAETLLANVARWMRDPVASCFEPRLVEMLSGLAHRALTSVLIRLIKLGGRPIKVDGDSVVVATPKYTLADAVSFSQFVTSSLQDQPMLILLAVQPARFWCPFVVLDRMNYAGLYVDAEDSAREHLEAAALTRDHAYTISNGLPRSLQALFRERVESTLARLFTIVSEVYAETAADPSVTLATRNEEMVRRIQARVKPLFDKQIQTELMDEVQRVMDSRELYSPEEVADLGGPEAALSASALALAYSKAVCQLLELVPCDGAVTRIRNNCMRLWGISPYSTQAAWEADPLNTTRMQTIVCGFCNTTITIDVMGKRKSAGAPFVCPHCHSPISAAAMEAHLVRYVNRRVAQHAQQDFVCSKCREMSGNYLCEDCCAPLVGSDPPIRDLLRRLKIIADTQQFAWLGECLDAAIMSC